MHYIRELVHDKTIILQYCPTDEQIANIFTKRFLEKKFTYLHSLLGVSSLGWSDYFQCSAWGGAFPTGFSLFSSLSLFFSIVSVLVLYRVTYGIIFQGPSIFMHFMFSTEYSLRGGVGDIYPPCTLNLVNLALLNHYPILWQPEDINISMDLVTR